MLKNQPQPLPYHVSERLHEGKCLVSTEGNDRGGVALTQDEATAAFLTQAANGFGAMLAVLQNLVNDIDSNAPGVQLPADYTARLRETLTSATAGLDMVRPQFDIWYSGISVEGDMRSNMQRAYVAGAAQHALAGVQQSDAEFPQVNLRQHQAAETYALYGNFKHIDGDFGAMQRAVKHAARSGYLNGFKDGKDCASTELAAGTLAQLQSLRAKVSASFELGSDLATSLPETTVKGTTYVPREAVMERVVKWRNQVDGLTPAGSNRHGAQPAPALTTGESNDAVRSLLASLLAKVGAAELMQAEFNRAITFAQTQGMDIDTFLRCWQHGDWDVLEKEFDYAEPKLPSIEDLKPTGLVIEVTAAMEAAFVAAVPTYELTGSLNWLSLQDPTVRKQCVSAMLAEAQPKLAGVGLKMASPATAQTS